MRIGLFIGMILFSITGIAQQSVLTDDAIVSVYSRVAAGQLQHDFEKNDYSSIDTGSLLVKVNIGNAAFFKKQFQPYIQRQLSASWFITKNTTAIQNSALTIHAMKANNSWKLSPSLLAIKEQLPLLKEFIFLIEVNDSGAFRHCLNTEGDYRVTVISAYNEKLFRIKTSLSFILNNLVNKSYVQSVSLYTLAPREETVINDYDNSVNAINLFFAKYPAINGGGLTASVKENLFDTSDIDFKGRYLPTPSGSASVTTHATIMATLIAGGGNSFNTAKGIAPESLLTSSNFANLLPDDNAIYQRYHISVQNHSYGTAIENFYGSDAGAFDQSVLDNPSLVYIFSAGNSGNQSPDGQYVNINGFANLTGSFKQAKNIITVGAVDSFYKVPLLSSKGPAYDGRIKPELVAYGNDGTSGAAAITSGTALAVQSAYASLHNDSLPNSALVKAILINSADDVENAGPDFVSGYGNVNTFRAVSEAISGHYFSGNITQSETKNLTLHVPANTKNIKITLVWNDAPAQTSAFTALVNDLDLQLENSTTHTLYLPWVLNSAPDSTTLLALPVRMRDSLNVVEQITIDTPAAGDYIIRVKGYDITTALQPFYIAYQTDTANHFTFISPSANDNAPPDNHSIFRWNSTYTAATGRLEYSVDKGFSWKLINANIDLSKKYFSWVAPDIFATALARMTIGNEQYFSDTFTLSKQLYIQVGFNCGDSALVYWNKAQGISSYQVYRLGEKYLEPFTVVNDTSLVVHNSINSPENFASQYVAVAPVISNNYTGVKSYAYNYTTQGAGCFINNFLADLTANNSARLQLFLGTLLHVKSVQFQQQTRSGWQIISTVLQVTGLNPDYVFDSLRNGINNFRAVVVLDNGDPIRSNTASIYYFKANPFIVFPNPIGKSGIFTILSQNVDAANTLMLYDAMGRKVLQLQMNSATEKISLKALAKGMYFMVILNESQPVFKSKLVVE